MVFFSGLEDYALLSLRIFIAVIFLIHGWRKVLLGPKGKFFFLLGLCETAGAVAVALGFLTQIAAAGFMLVMSGAIYMKIHKWKISFIAENATGWELDFIIFGSSLALLFLGGGSFSVDAFIGFQL